MNTASADPQVFLSLIPVSYAAMQVFAHTYNENRHNRGSYQLDPQAKEADGTREQTPSRDGGEIEPSIDLRLDKPPKNKALGHVFGSDPEKCDCYLGRSVDGISRCSFAIKHQKVSSKAFAVGCVSLSLMSSEWNALHACVWQYE